MDRINYFKDNKSLVDYFGKTLWRNDVRPGFNQDPLEYAEDILSKDQINESQIETFEDEKEDGVVDNYNNRVEDDDK